MTRHYPGYKHHNLGKYTNLDIYALIGSAPPHNQRHEDTTALRLSLALNKLGGQHRLGTDEIHISKNYKTDSLRGRDGLQYIFRTTAYGPFLAMKYKSPELIRINLTEPDRTYDSIMGRRGIIRFVTFHNGARHADARILLWDCDRPYQSRDFGHMHHLISIEFWDLPGECYIILSDEL